MANNKKGKTSLCLGSATRLEHQLSVGELRAQNSELRAELEAAQSALRDLRRDKTYTVKHIQEQEQLKSSITIKDMKAKLHTEKLKELELQREALLRKCDVDLQKVARQKEMEIKKLQGDLRKCQDELRDVTRRGLSGSAREAFEAERGRMRQEVQELRSSRRMLEEQVQCLQQSNRQQAHLLRTLEEKNKTLFARQKRQANSSMRKLVY